MSSAATTSSTLSVQPLPTLEGINVRLQGSDQVTSPTKRIQSDADLAEWKSSRAHHNVALFVARLGEAAVGKETRSDKLDGSTCDNAAVVSVLRVLHEINGWTKEIEPQATRQRFGNLAFRDWGRRLEASLVPLHVKLLESKPELQAYIPELKEHLYDSFGSFVRIDYGSGHEVNFVAWLGYLYRLGFFEDCPVGSTQQSAERSPSRVEEELALRVFPLYLEVVWGLQDRYALEPAGSHGVWGLDDYQFLPYILGAAQLRLQNEYKPQGFSKPSHKPSQRLSAPELLAYSPSLDPPPFVNMFTSSIARIHSLKTGPFSEHSPLLNDISATVPNWRKVHSGMLKMWENEVLGKRPVVQHFVFGGVGYVWEGSGHSTNGTASQRPHTESSVPGAGPASVGTGAPWAQPMSRPPAAMAALGAPASALGPRVGTALPRTRQAPGTAAPWARQGG